MAGEEISLPFNLFNPDGSQVMAIDLKTGKEVPIVRKLTACDVSKMKRLGYRVELVSPRIDVGIDKSQPRGDR